MVSFVSGQCELFHKTLPLHKSIKKTIIGLKHLSMSQLSNLIESKSFCGNTLKSYSTCYAMLHETLRKWKMLFLFFLNGDYSLEVPDSSWNSICKTYYPYINIGAIFGNDFAWHFEKVTTRNVYLFNGFKFSFLIEPILSFSNTHIFYDDIKYLSTYLL